MVYQIIEDICRAYVATKPTKWKQYLPLLELVYKSSKYTKCTQLLVVSDKM